MLEKNYICSMRLVRQIPHEHFLISLHQYNDNYLLSITLDDYQQQFKVPVSSISNLEHLEQQLTPAFYSACLQDFIRMRERWLQLLKPLQHD
ncbi:MAG: hypothetical protein RL371_1054 [Bacteroidota bacterium]